MSEIDPILIGKGEHLQYLLPSFGNRHGLITGATGTGKTVTLQVLAEGFSRIGVPVFLADVIQGMCLVTMLAALMLTRYRIRWSSDRHG